jgi:hypothetical protein
MQPVAQALGDAPMSELANYFSKQTAPLADAHSAASPQFLQAGKQLAEVGVPTSLLASAVTARKVGAMAPGLRASREDPEVVPVIRNSFAAPGGCGE